MKNEDGRFNYVAIEGNIGAGKTSICAELSKYSHQYKILKEEINGLLPYYYEDPKKYAFAFQWTMLKSRIYQFNIAYTENKFRKDINYVVDRSVLGDYAFAIHNFLLGTLSSNEMDVYEETLGGNLNNLTDIPYVKNTLKIIFINTEPEICKYRVENLRKVPCESNIPLEYYVGIDDIYFHMLIEILKSEKNHVMVINNNHDEVKDVKTIQFLDNFINNPSIWPTQLKSDINTEVNLKLRSETDVINLYKKIIKYPKVESFRCPKSVGIPYNIMWSENTHKLKNSRYRITFYKNEYKRVVMWLLSKHVDIYLYEED